MPTLRLSLGALTVAALCFWSVPGESQLLGGLGKLGGLLGGDTGEPPKSGAFSEPRSISTPGGERFFLVYTPADYRPGNPVVLALHGGNLSYDIVTRPGNPFAAIADLADEHAFLLVVPNGTSSLLPAGFPGWADGASGKVWNDCRAGDNREADDVGFLSQLIALVTDADGEFGADGGRVFVMGQSNGGFMAQRMALERPHLVRAVGSTLANVAAAGDNECVIPNPPRPVPIALINGDQDTLVPWKGSVDANGNCPALSLSLTGCLLSAEDSRDFWVAYNGNIASPRVDRLLPNLSTADRRSRLREMLFDRRTGFGSQPAPAPVAFYRANLAGHIEPSIAYVVGTAGETAFGNQNNDAEGYGLIWDFFAGLPASD